MTRLMVHIATGPENPTRVALGLLVARSALEAGHDVDLFIAGDGVGPEVTRAAMRVIEAAGVPIDWEAAEAGASVFYGAVVRAVRRAFAHQASCSRRVLA